MNNTQLLFHFTLFFLTLATLSCTTNESEIKLDSSLLNGEWRFDSASNNYSYDHSLIVDSDRYYQFSWWSGGRLSDYGQVIGVDSIQRKHDNVFFELLDSNRLELINEQNVSYFYNRSTYGDYKEELQDYLKADSLRSTIIGWWQVVEAKQKIELINYHEDCETFTLNIGEDGQAVFFRNNYLDSAVNYRYRVSPGIIDFARGCIAGSDSKIRVDEKGFMHLHLDPLSFDTLKLRRIYQIK